MKKTEVRLLRDKAIIKFRGQDFLGVVGIDSRIFSALTEAGISVGVISQQAAEDGVSVIVDASESMRAVRCLETEFSLEKSSGKVRLIYSTAGVSVLSFYSTDYHKIAGELARNNILPLILSQVAAEHRVDIVVHAAQDAMAKSIIENEVAGKPKNVHLALFGHGTVGGTLIGQVLARQQEIRQRKNINLKIIAIANSRCMILNGDGFGESWQEQISSSQTPTSAQKVLDFAKANQLENLVLVDNTASKEFVINYPKFAESGADIVSSNKVFNTLPVAEYRNLRKILKKNGRQYLYETNVGAGLPLIDTIKLLHLSGENITRIKGVFSGSLSYIFNNFSVRDEKFSTIVNEAMDKGFTEPDPREDLSGNDVARKLLILARELDLVNEFEDINIKNLVPEPLQNLEKSEFISRLAGLDEEFSKIKSSQENDFVLRYVGDLHGDLQQEKGELDVKLMSVPASSALGQLKGSDSIFEIYTESYGENPIVIMGAGAGANVTARGVFGDILRISEAK